MASQILEAVERRADAKSGSPIKTCTLLGAYLMVILANWHGNCKQRVYAERKFADLASLIRYTGALHELDDEKAVVADWRHYSPVFNYVYSAC